jgi:hypothetical protein
MGIKMFGEFSLETKKSEDCTADCTIHKYQLKARYLTYLWYSVYSLESEVIVTQINRFFQRVNIEGRYEGIIIVGVSFKDQKGITVKSTKDLYFQNYLSSTSTSLVCGTETGPSAGWMNEVGTSSGWMLVGGPIKGSYLIKND